MSSTDTTHSIDAARLTRYLRSHLEGLEAQEGELEVLKLNGGQSNPTYAISLGDRRWVLRKKPPGKLLPSAHQIEREHRVISALAACGFPVPKAHLLCDDASVIGTAFYVMEHMAGRILRDPSLPEIARDARASYYEAMARVLARLHDVDPRAIGLESYGKPEGFVARQVSRWTQQYEASKTDDVREMNALSEWFAKNIPDESAGAIVHGDIRIDNIVWHPTEPRVIALLDWELSTLGNPYSDAAYACLAYHMPRGVDGLPGLAGLDLDGLAIPNEDQFVAVYCEQRGLSEIPSWAFFVAFSLFRLAAITQGVYARALQGNASSSNAIEVGRLSSTLAKIGWEVASSSR
ncbi:MAG: phosphotransferase [Polyangiaceae bacterium]